MSGRKNILVTFGFVLSVGLVAAAVSVLLASYHYSRQTDFNQPSPCNHCNRIYAEDKLYGSGRIYGRGADYASPSVYAGDPGICSAGILSCVAECTQNQSRRGS